MFQIFGKFEVPLQVFFGVGVRGLGVVARRLFFDSVTVGIMGPASHSVLRVWSRPCAFLFLAPRCYKSRAVALELAELSMPAQVLPVPAEAKPPPKARCPSWCPSFITFFVFGMVGDAQSCS